METFPLGNVVTFWLFQVPPSLPPEGIQFGKTDTNLQNISHPHPQVLEKKCHPALTAVTSVVLSWRTKLLLSVIWIVCTMGKSTNVWKALSYCGAEHRNTYIDKLLFIYLHSQHYPNIWSLPYYLWIYPQNTLWGREVWLSPF